MLQKEIKVALHTLGCKVNQYETEAIRERLLDAGFSAAEEGEPADVHVINTCTVTNMADRKSRQIIRRAVRGGTPSGMEPLVVVTGCYAQMKGEEISNIEGVSIITGTDEKSRIPSLIEELLNKREAADAEAESHRSLGHTVLSSVKEYGDLTEYENLGQIKEMGSRTRAFVKIQEGCDRFCSYCIIPYARGTLRSRPEDSIISECKGLVGSGYKELVLTGINTALYGRDKDPATGAGLFSLLKKLDDIPGDFRVRLSSLEPTVVVPEDAKWLGSIKRLCHHMHLSIQSGSDRILKAMNRRYLREDYLKIVEALRSIDPHYGISTDIIAGFPGETEEDFRDSIRIAEEVDFVRIHGFRFSGRDGTPAAKMKDQIPEDVKAERADALAEAGLRSSRRFLEASVGDVRRVLIEREEKTCGTTYLTGYTDNYIKVYVPAKDGSDRVSEDAAAAPKPDTFADLTLTGLFQEGMLGRP